MLGLPKQVLKPRTKNRRWRAEISKTTFIPKSDGSSLKILGLKKRTLSQANLPLACIPCVENA
jgi:hypothetical protein